MFKNYTIKIWNLGVKLSFPIKASCNYIDGSMKQCLLIQSLRELPIQTTLQGAYCHCDCFL